MELTIYDINLNLCGIVDIYSSLIWTRKYFTAGEFTLTAPVTVANISILQKKRLICKANSTEVGYISGITITLEGNEEVIICSGFMLSGLLNRRIIKAGNSDFMTLLDLNCGAGCTDSNRRFNALEVEKLIAIGSLYTDNLKYENLAAYAEAICRLNNIGLCVSFEHGATNRLLLYTYKGVDRSVNQTENPYVIFSQDYDNLKTAEYTYNEAGAVNTVYGYSPYTSISKSSSNSSGIGVNLIVNSVANYTLNDIKNTGYDRFESAVEVAAIMKQETDEEGNSYEVFDSTETQNALEEACNQMLIDIGENVQGEILETKTGYKELWNLGDIVTVQIKQWGITLNQRIYEVCEVYEGGSVQIVPTFGSPKAQILDLLKGV